MVNSNSATWHLAVFNRGMLQEKAGSESNQEFIAALAPVMQIAEKSKGMVWRFRSPTDGPNDKEYKDIDLQFPGMALLNLSVWESMDDLKHFMYKSGHAAYYKRRREWFEVDAKNASGDLPPKAPNNAPHHVLWWIPAGSTPPSFEDAIEKCTRLVEHGETAEAFTMRRPFPSPDGRQIVPTCPGSLAVRKAAANVSQSEPTRAVSSGPSSNLRPHLLLAAMVVGASLAVCKALKTSHV
jgi:hypothetical protein